MANLERSAFSRLLEPSPQGLVFVDFFPLLAFHSLPYGHRAVIGWDRLGGWYDLVCFGGCWAETEVSWFLVALRVDSKGDRSLDSRRRVAREAAGTCRC
jgi:hypothetical protein